MLDKSRQLIHSGKLLRQPDSGLDWNNWSELHVLLFDNYCKFDFSTSLLGFNDLLQFSVVMTKPKEKDGVAKYQVNRRVRLDSLWFLHIHIVCLTACPVGLAITG